MIRRSSRLEPPQVREGELTRVPDRNTVEAPPQAATPFWIQQTKKKKERKQERRKKRKKERKKEGKETRKMMIMTMAMVAVAACFLGEGRPAGGHRRTRVRRGGGSWLFCMRCRAAASASGKGRKKDRKKKRKERKKRNKKRKTHFFKCRTIKPNI